MQLVAYLNGQRFDATVISHEAWRALKNLPGYPDMVLPECGARAVRRTSHRRTQFFAHYRNAGCGVEHKSETPQHLAMKRAVAERINVFPGWRAEVEYADAGREWIADVMAFADDGRTIAFEVQLSHQTEEDYARRSQRYFDDRIGPVWLVPRPLDYMDLKIPQIVTGFGKSSEVPDTPADLMRHETYQPLTREFSDVRTVIDRMLSRRVTWPHGSPADQERAREEARRQAEAARVLAQQRDEAARALRQRQAEEERRRFEAETAAFIEGAMPAAVTAGQTPVHSPSGSYIWASLIRCRQNGHQVLVWQAQATEPLAVDSQAKPRRREDYLDVRLCVQRLQAATGIGLTAQMVRLKGRPPRSGFACPICGDLIGQRFIAALPPQKWSLIAVPAPGKPVLPENQIPQRPRAITRPARKEPKNGPVSRRQPSDPRTVKETDPDFVGPQRRPYWHTEVRDAAELSYRQAAKDAVEARKQAMRDNPQYLDHGNDFRFTCRACGQEFEDYNEGIHAGARCTDLSQGGSAGR